MNDFLILISHGSGGLGYSEYNIAQYFLKKGFKVGLLDYFSKWNVDRLWWSNSKLYIDEIDVPFQKMLTDIDFPENKIVHVGFSLGGFLGILNSHKFYKNYCFYPGIIGFTESLISKNYSNTTVFIPEFDNWCDYVPFENHCIFPPKKVKVKNSYHGFMIKDKDKTFDVNKYNTPKYSMSEDEFNLLRPSHSYLSQKYNYTKETIRLLYNKKSCINCLNTIIKDLYEHNNNIT